MSSAKSVKEVLHNAIELMSEEEVLQTLVFVQNIQRGRRGSKTLSRLASDPAFNLPPGGAKMFRLVEAIQGKGIAASKLLLESRR
jgi:hypothetical protein